MRDGISMGKVAIPDSALLASAAPGLQSSRITESEKMSTYTIVLRYPNTDDEHYITSVDAPNADAAFFEAVEDLNKNHGLEEEDVFLPDEIYLVACFDGWVKCVAADGVSWENVRRSAP